MFFTLLHNLFYTSRSATAPLSLSLSAYCLSKSQSHDSAPKRIPLVDSTCCGEDDFIAQAKGSISLLGTSHFTILTCSCCRWRWRLEQQRHQSKDLYQCFSFKHTNPVFYQFHISTLQHCQCCNEGIGRPEFPGQKR